MRIIIIILLFSMQNTYSMKAGRKRSNSTNSSLTQLRHSDSSNSLSHSDPLSTHVKNHDSLKDLYNKLNPKVIDLESKINTLQTKITFLETKLSRLSIINSIFITSLIVTAGIAWYKWPTILVFLRNQ